MPPLAVDNCWRQLRLRVGPARGHDRPFSQPRTSWASPV